MVETQCEMARLNEKSFEIKKLAGGLVIVLFVVVGSQMAADSPFSDQRCLAAGCWGQWVTRWHRQPNRNMGMQVSSGGVQHSGMMRRVAVAVKQGQ